MSIEELYGRVWRSLARKEGHRPMHLVNPRQEEKREDGRKKGAHGVTAGRIRDLADEGLTITEIARALGISPSTVHDHSSRHGIKLVNGRAA